MKLRVGDKVIVTTGKFKGVISSIEKIDKNKQLVTLDEGVTTKKHQKKINDESKGEIVEVKVPISISNVAYYDDDSKSKSRISFKLVDGKKHRHLVKLDKKID